MTSNTRSKRSVGRFLVAAAAAFALTLSGVSPALAVGDPSGGEWGVPEAWPDAGPFVAQTKYGPNDYVDYATNGWLPLGASFPGGYPVDVMLPGGELPDVVCPAGSAPPTQAVVKFEDDRGVSLAPVVRSGWGSSSVAEYYGFVVFASQTPATPLIGTLEAYCAKPDGTATSTKAWGGIPLAITASPAPLYATDHQYTWVTDASDTTVSFNALGFVPGEQVRVSLLQWADSGAVLAAPSTVVIPDGVGAITLSRALPAGVARESLSVLAVGATSRYAIEVGLDGDDDTTPTVTASIAGGTVRKANVSVTGYDAGSSVRVALHSASAAVVLGELTASASGSATGTFDIPASVAAGSYRLWAGERTGGFLLLTTPVTVPAVTVPTPTPTPSPSPSPTPSPSVSFVDVSSVSGSAAFSAFAVEIGWMASSGISTGYPVAGGKREYRPFAPVARDAMAAFMYRAAGSPAFTVPARSPFVDVSVSHPFYKEIAWMAAQKISTGWDVGGRKQFRPSESITRDAMAAFLYRFAKSPVFAMPARSPFVDVSLSQPFAKEMAWLASTGVSTGWVVGSRKEFRPYNPITRDAMAAFLYRYNNR